MKLSDAASAMGGILHGEDTSFEYISIDSRSLQAGELFIAIRGENFDGEAFVERASLAGACASVVTKHQNDLEHPQIVVENTGIALGKLAHFKRSTMNAKVVAITGSCGKTSVKGMLKEILSLHGATYATLGNNNNQIGVPLTILAADKNIDYLVVEAGTSFKGEIGYLSAIIDPDVALAINVHPAHIEGFGSLEAIADEKSDIYSAGVRSPISVVNTELNRYPVFSEKVSGELVRFSSGNDEHTEDCDVLAENVQLNTYGCANFQIKVREELANISLSVLGLHQVENALAAAACAVALNIPLELICQGLSAYQGEKGRMQYKALKNGVLINDTYNANPASMRAAIDYLASQQNSVLMLGDMGELGKDAEIEHRGVGEYAKLKGITKLYCTGYFAEDYADAFGENAEIFRTQEAMVQHAIENLGQAFTVLVKGSRSAKMDLVYDALQQELEAQNNDN